MSCRQTSSCWTTNQTIVVVDKEQKTAVVKNVSIPADSNIREKEHEKTKKYQGLKEQLEQM